MQINKTVRKKDNKYQVMISYKQNNKWKTKSKQGFNTIKEAKVYGEKLIEEIKKQAELNTPDEFENIKLKDLITFFLETSKKTLAPNTIAIYSIALNRLKPLEDKEVSKITSMDLIKLFNEMIGTYKDNTIRISRAVCQTLFRKAIKPYRIITENPMADLDLNLAKKTEKKILTKQEINELLFKLKDINYLYYVMASISAFTGLRFSEVLGLTWNDIDLNKKTINVNKQWNKLPGGGDGMSKTKTENSIRTVYFPTTLQTILIDYKKNHLQHISGRLMHGISRVNASPALSKIFRELGYDITFHSLRHSYATILLSEGTDIKTVAALLGDTVNTIIETYIHYSEEMREKAKEQIENIF